MRKERNMENISKSGLKELLANVTAATPEQDEALRALTELCDSAGDNMILADLAGYDQYVLWNGEDDVRNAIESGAFEELSGLDEKEMSRFISAAASRIDWEQVDEACCEAGNNLVHQAIDEELSELESYTRKTVKSDVRVHKPDGIHSWGIEYNFEADMDDADASDFVATVNEMKSARNMSGILFHQCGSSLDSHEKGYTGYQFFEYWGPAPSVIVRRLANDVAEKLKCKVV